MNVVTIAPVMQSQPLSDSKTRWVLIVSLVLSIVIHLLIMFFAYRVQPFEKHETAMAPTIDVNLVESRAPIAETLQETAKEKPKDTKFESSRNLKTDEETSPKSAPMDMPNRGGAAKNIPKPRVQAKSKAPGTLFSMNQKDLIADRENEETLTAEGQGIDSTGFIDRLRRGEMLKINAGESDYAQFIRRMKEKLIQHWSPLKVITAEMYKYNEVRVDIAVILNTAGEIVELRILNGSMFSRYDQEGLRALREAGPFPNPHKSLIQDDGLVYMPWSFTLYMNGQGVGAGIE